MKLYSWNVNGLRAVINKGALQTFLEQEKPDILCLQEIKCKPEQCDFDFAAAGYEIFWNPAEKPGYSGTAILIKHHSCLHETVPRSSYESFEASEPHNDGRERARLSEDCYDALTSTLAATEGRVLTLEFPAFYLVNVYTPNSKPDLSRLALREQSWDPGFLNYLKELEKSKPVITCGDFNAAHTEIDIARPKTNCHSAGFTDEERQGITNLVNTGFLDTFRFLHPSTQRYTWWSHWGHARENNIGWRIDYFFISKSLQKHLKSAEIYENILGSDHCPISIEMEF